MIHLLELVDAGNAQVHLENCIAKMEEQLKDKQEQLRKLSIETIPNMMAEIGISEITLTGGQKIGVVDRYYAKLPEDNYAAFTWLRTNNMDGIIKTQVTIDIGKGEDDKLREIETILQAAGVIPTVKSTVHHMTLKALVKEQVEKGNSIPLDDFGAGSFRVSVIKK